jgi:glycine/D-amino acid oxidase-like deaminating enzyme
LDAGPVSCIAGLRPKRKGGYRLEMTKLDSKFLIHNYGHGGSGITMSWGCAEEVRELALASGLHPESTPVAVIGAGVMGLTTATLLLEAGFTTSLYARETFLATTSIISGGPWSPSLVDHDTSPAGTEEFERILRRAFRAHERRIGCGFGVERRDLYTMAPSENMAKVPRDVVAEPERLSRLPFENLNVPGYRYSTLLIEPPIMLARLENDLHSAGARFVQRSFRKLGDVAALTEPIVVNCTGLGSKELWPDSRLAALKGHLAILPPQPRLEYLFSDSRYYVFPRNDCVVIGGTYTWETDPTPHMDVCHQLILEAKKLFGRAAN